jgi:hypothetical protein
MLSGECVADPPADKAKHESEKFRKRSNMVLDSCQFGFNDDRRKGAFRSAGAISLRSHGRHGDFEGSKCRRGLLQSGD